MKHQSLGIVFVTTIALSACGTASKDVRDNIDKKQKISIRDFNTPVQIAPLSRVTERRGKVMPVTAVTNIRTNDWLKKIQVEMKIDNPTSLSAIVEKLSAQGLNIVSDLPLNSYTYTGQVTRTDADAALKVILGSVGLDFKPDDARKIVMIKPMASRSWTLDIGKRHSSYSSDGSTSPNNSSSGTSMPGANGAGVSGIASGSSATGGGSGATALASGMPGQGANTSASQSSGTSVASTDDFWPSLSDELKSRLSVLVPRDTGAFNLQGMQGISPLAAPGLGTQLPSFGMPQPIGMRGGMTDQSGGIQYMSRQIGTYALNPETGNITVQAPHWMLDDLDVYFGRVQKMYNTDMTFSGEVVLVTSNSSDSEGFDLSAFATWASGKYSAVITNNALGGITVSLPGSGTSPSVNAGSQAVAGPLMGLQYQGSRTTMSIFNDFLAENGQVSVIQKPRVTTTSGVPGVFSKKFTDYYNTVSQQAAAGGTGSATSATMNTIVPIELGTELRINPRINIATGLIRAQLVLNQSIKSGTKNVPQTITSGNSTTTINASIPLVTRQNISGEVLLADGDLIVVGGQSEDNLAADENGLPGKDGPIGGIFGVKKATRGAQTYYFALRVSVSKR